MGEARHGSYSIFGDVMYTKISGQAGTPRGILATEVELSSEVIAGLLGIDHAILEGSSARLDLVGGLRVWHSETQLSFSGGFLDGRSASDGAIWVDGLARLRGTYSLTPEIYLTGWGLIGAGGADLDWDVATAIGYRFSDTVSAVAGYRALGGRLRQGRLRLRRRSARPDSRAGRAFLGKRRRKFSRHDRCLAQARGAVREARHALA